MSYVVANEKQDADGIIKPLSQLQFQDLKQCELSLHEKMLEKETPFSGC